MAPSRIVSLSTERFYFKLLRHTCGGPVEECNPGIRRDDGEARQGPWVDTRALPGLVDAAARCAPLRVVLADAEFDSEANHQHIRKSRCSPTKALFRHNLAGVFREEPCAARCTALFLRKSMHNERKWKRSSRR